MNFAKTRIYLILIALCCFSMSSHSALINRGGGMIYDTALDITWLKDANYAKTSGANSDGLFSFTQAKDWVANLSFGGYSDWRLPTFTPSSGSDFDFAYSFNGSTDRGYNTGRSNNELAYMFDINLNNEGAFTSTGLFTNPSANSFSSSFIDAKTNQRISFFNIENEYWTGAAGPFDNTAWGFGLKTNSDIELGESILYSTGFAKLGAWAVRDGDVVQAQNPVLSASAPNTISMLFFAILLVLVLKSKSHAR